LSFASNQRIFVFGNCCVVPDFGEAHQWAQAHFLVSGGLFACQTVASDWFDGI
jgi:hypothetical protein